MLSSTWITDWLWLCLWPAIQFWGKSLNFCPLNIFQLENEWSLTCIARGWQGSITMVWNVSEEWMQWKIPWSCSAAALGAHLPCPAVSPVQSILEACLDLQRRSFPTCTQCSCKGWCKLQMNEASRLFGFNKGFLSPCEAGLGFFLNPVRKPLLYSAFREAVLE